MTAAPDSAPAACPAAFLAAEGPAFPWLVKALASLLMAALLFWGVRAADQIAATAWSAGAAAFMLAALLVIALCYYWILRSRTKIDAISIEQSWLWPKKVALVEVTQAKFIYVPFMTWLIAPRLVIRSSGRGMFVFQAADPQVLQAFARLSLGPTLLIHCVDSKASNASSADKPLT